MSRHVGDQETADASGGAAGGVINIAAAVGFAVGFAVDPGIQPAEFHALRGELVSAPDFHARHVLLRCGPHAGIIISGMKTLKGAAVLAFIGTLLVAALLVYDFVFTVLNVIRGLTPAVTVFSSLIYAFGALSVTVFFYIFQKQQS
jgi:hypothetical protein